MTEHFHVHGPHDHELEHAAHNAHLDPLSGRIAVMTAILATSQPCSPIKAASRPNRPAPERAAITKTERQIDGIATRLRVTDYTSPK